MPTRPRLTRSGRGAILVATVLAVPAAATTFHPAQAAVEQLAVVAHAHLAQYQGAEIEVRIDGRIAGSFTADTNYDKTYWVPLSESLDAGERLTLRFTNDYWLDGEDRNFYLTSVSYGGQKILATDTRARYDAGSTWATSVDGVQRSAGTNLMSWNGSWLITWPAASLPQASTAPAPAPTATPTAAAALPRPFRSSSFWYQPIPATASIHPNSAAIVDNIENDLLNHGTATVNTDGYAPPIYVVDSSTPSRRVERERCGAADSDPTWVDQRWFEQFAAVPVPANAQAAAGEDREMIIWNPSTQEVWEMWQFKRSSTGTLSACWGAKTSDALSSDGVIPRPFGVTGSGLSLLGGTIRLDELKTGRINHVMTLGVNRPRAGMYSWPANRTDGTWTSSTAVMEGQRFRLDPTLDVDSLKISPIAKIIARAAQEYGFVVRDNSTGPLVVYAESKKPVEDRTGQDPYAVMFPQEHHTWMVGFPWHRLQAMPIDYGQP